MFNRIKKNWDRYQHEQSVKRSWADYHSKIEQIKNMLREQFANTPMNEGVLDTCANIYVGTDNDNDNVRELINIDVAHSYPMAAFVMMRAAKHFGWKQIAKFISDKTVSNNDIYI